MTYTRVRDTYYLRNDTETLERWISPLEYGGFATTACHRRNCKTCPQLHTSNTIKSYVTDKTYLSSLHRQAGNCRTKSVVYGINCNKCNTCVYVGITIRTLNERFLEHRNNIIKGKSAHLHIYKHFRNDEHNVDNMTVQIIYRSKSIQTNDINNDLRDKELLWIKILNTAYPLGCNENIKNYGNILEETNFVNKTNHP